MNKVDSDKSDEEFTKYKAQEQTIRDFQASKTDDKLDSSYIKAGTEKNQHRIEYPIKTTQSKKNQNKSSILNPEVDFTKVFGKPKQSIVAPTYLPPSKIPIQH